jgi:hypothetical protein
VADETLLEFLLTTAVAVATLMPIVQPRMTIRQRSRGVIMLDQSFTTRRSKRTSHITVSLVALCGFSGFCGRVEGIGSLLDNRITRPRGLRQPLHWSGDRRYQWKPA